MTESLQVAFDEPVFPHILQFHDHSEASAGLTYICPMFSPLLDMYNTSSSFPVSKDRDSLSAAAKVA